MTYQTRGLALLTRSSSLASNPPENYRERFWAAVREKEAWVAAGSKPPKPAQKETIDIDGPSAESNSKSSPAAAKAKPKTTPSATPSTTPAAKPATPNATPAAPKTKPATPATPATTPTTPATKDNAGYRWIDALVKAAPEEHGPIEEPTPAPVDDSLFVGKFAKVPLACRVDYTRAAFNATDSSYDDPELAKMTWPSEDGPAYVRRCLPCVRKGTLCIKAKGKGTVCEGCKGRKHPCGAGDNCEYSSEASEGRQGMSDAYNDYGRNHERQRNRAGTYFQAVDFVPIDTGFARDFPHMRAKKRDQDILDASRAAESTPTAVFGPRPPSPSLLNPARPDRGFKHAVGESLDYLQQVVRHRQQQLKLCEEAEEKEQGLVGQLGMPTTKGWVATGGSSSGGEASRPAASVKGNGASQKAIVARSMKAAAARREREEREKEEKRKNKKKRM
ncbi:hypothetical protein BDZ90DRAFT_226431 [Jaminaea rosea]|uniref:Uncharacterized protein n=1 Tax=Jaminaea rosea TaxID=1569628 RepID=A0A316UVC8_9BASI|nr:hypothetical protein BDZ90DRAFT_226431 [Jaminaea rosea]PWN29260.1 hypothetical protein BDZ90DRAFT_226431 [Jaminaea rosea]